MKLLLALFSILSATAAYNVAIFAPFVATSQVLWNKRVGETLAKAGHNVTIYFIHPYDFEIPALAVDPRIRVEHVNATYGLDYNELQKKHAAMAFEDLSFLDPRTREAMRTFFDMHKSCASLVRNDTFLNDVKDSKFDVAFSHMYNSCPIGVIHVTKIPGWIWLNSGALVDRVASSVGVPLPPSFCPPMMMNAGDRLTFVQRIKSFFGHIFTKVVHPRMTVDKETAVFREVFGDDFPHLADLGSKAPLVMVNSNELYDFPRPTLAKVVNVGGVGAKMHDAKNLTGEYLRRTNLAKDGIIVFSFGSVAAMHLLPQKWKDAFFGAFAEFPNIQFFMRHEYPDKIASELPSNVYASTWMPQMDLLSHPKALALISHGGYNSVQDAIHTGKPIMTTALFGDQHRNSQLAKRLGFGLILEKSELAKEAVVERIKQFLEDKSLTEKAVKMRSMVMSKPIPAETLLVKWTEFVAQHGTLDNLIPAGNELNLFVYHSVDVIAFLFVVLIVLGFVLFVVLRKVGRLVICCCKSLCSRFCNCSPKPKSE